MPSNAGSPYFKTIGGVSYEVCAAKDYLNLADLFKLIICLNVRCL